MNKIVVYFFRSSNIFWINFKNEDNFLNFLDLIFLGKNVIVYAEKKVYIKDRNELIRKLFKTYEKLKGRFSFVENKIYFSFRSSHLLIFFIKIKSILNENMREIIKNLKKSKINKIEFFAKNYIEIFYYPKYFYSEICFLFKNNLNVYINFLANLFEKINLKYEFIEIPILS